jgi:hypothetical protein
VVDTFTGTNLPNIIWGYGKADAFNTLTNCSLTSTENIQEYQISLGVYPNPVHSGENVSIGYTGTNRNVIAEVHIADITGRVIKRHTLSRSHTNVISTKDLKAGIYLLTLVENGSNRKSTRLTVIE